MSEGILAGDSLFEEGDPSISFPALSPMFQPEILALFLFDCVVVLGIASLIVFHPARLKTRRGVRDYELPRLFMVYGLIGMAIGFLVLQHGAVIGFVVFGIGGLLRFRSVLRNSTDTVEVILVTLLGLCVGLNLQNMAVLIGIASWIVIWFFGRKRTYQLSLKHTSTEGLAATMARLEEAMPKFGWELDSQKEFGQHSNSTNANAAATVIFRSRGNEDLSDIEAELSSQFQGEGVEWRLK